MHLVKLLVSGELDLGQLILQGNMNYMDTERRVESEHRRAFSTLEAQDSRSQMLRWLVYRNFSFQFELAL